MRTLLQRIQQIKLKIDFIFNGSRVTKVLLHNVILFFMR